MKTQTISPCAWMQSAWLIGISLQTISANGSQHPRPTWPSHTASSQPYMAKVHSPLPIVHEWHAIKWPANKTRLASIVFYLATYLHNGVSFKTVMLYNRVTSMQFHFENGAYAFNCYTFPMSCGFSTTNKSNNIKCHYSPRNWQLLSSSNLTLGYRTYYPKTNSTLPTPPPPMVSPFHTS